MSNPHYVKAAIAQTVLQLAPPLIQKSILDESAFRQEYGFSTEEVLTFGDPGFSIRSSELFDAVREALANIAEIEVTDIDGRTWKLRNEAGIGEPPKIVFSFEQQRLSFPNFALLSPDTDVRLRFLDWVTSDVNLPDNSRDTWRNILTERALKDDEFEPFHSDLRDTPVHWVRSIRNEISVGKCSISSLIPSSRRYFERLVGIYDGSTSIRDYAAGAGKNFIRQLSSWKPYEGYLFSLFLSSHAALTDEIDIQHLEQEDIVRAYDFLERSGDMISRLGAIEVGLRILPDNPKIEPVIIRLIQQIRDDDIDGTTSEFNLLSALFILVDGEIARTRLLSDEPPFYRRLASLSHAALIHRQIVNSGADYHFFRDWAFQHCGQRYFMQSFCDMRLAPRWNPNSGGASQMKAYFFSRIMISAQEYEKNIGDGELQGLIFGEHASIYSLSDFLGLHSPEPLEGNENSANVLPCEFFELIKEQLVTDNVGPSSFIALVNFGMAFHVDSAQAELAVKALRSSNYLLVNVRDKTEILCTLNGLAAVAATSRNSVLAGELRILLRKYRGDVPYSLSIEEELFVCLIAAASHSDLADWRNFVGDWLTELAFGELKDDEAKMLRSHLLCLCHSVPELWLSCGKADAALMAFCGR